MQTSIPLGRIGGVRVGINWSWFIVFALIAWTLASAVFPDQNPGLGDGTYVGMALVAALLFFVSILLHELGHAVQARREGVEIEGITLWLFGGVAKLKGAFPSAGAELRIAVAGPLVSLAIGVAGVVLAAAVALPDAVDGVSAWLGTMNLTLLVFNLLPALPLDGGRVLRALLWSRKGDLVAATRAAASVAQVIAITLIAAGVALLIVEGAFSGAWLVFIGWFLLQAANAESAAAEQQAALGGLRVRDLMVHDPATVDADATLGEFVDTVLAERRHTTYPVVDAGRAVGLLTLRRVAAVARSEWDTTTVRECMAPAAEVPQLSEDDDLQRAFEALGASALRRGLVVRDGRLVGFLSLSDLTFPVQFGPWPHERRAQTGGRRPPARV
jgi:Zn-dependent protease/CBS domain-containing protein